MDTKEVFRKLIQRIHGFRNKWGNSSRRPVGLPGEYVKELSSEEREALSYLKAEDLTAEKIPRDEIEMFTEYDWEESFRQKLTEDKLAFDKKMKK
jgi:hypothetical protein